MTKEDHIKEAELEMQKKFAAQIDLFKEKPAMKDIKEKLNVEIIKHLALKKDYENLINEQKIILSSLAEDALKLQDMGVFWDYEEYSVCKAPKKKDVKEMIKYANKEKLSEYKNSQKQTKKLKENMLKEIFPIYVKTKPSIRCKGEISNEEDEE